MKPVFSALKLVGLSLVVSSFSLAVYAKEEAPKKPAETASLSSAKNLESSPHKLVENATDRVVTLVKEKGDDLKKSPDKYYDQFSEMLDSLVDFPFIAKHVMGKKAYLSASEQQRKDFANAFKRDLIKTYTGALATYSDREFNVIPPKDAVGEVLRTTVVQEISGPEGKLNVAYTMNRSDVKSPWKMINFTLPGQGVNLGATSRKQFSQAMVSNKGNLEAVITSWGS